MDDTAGSPKRLDNSQFYVLYCRVMCDAMKTQHRNKQIKMGEFHAKHAISGIDYDERAPIHWHRLHVTEVVLQ